MADDGPSPWINVIIAGCIGGGAGAAAWHWLVPTEPWGIACIPAAALLFAVAAYFLGQQFWDWVFTFMR